ncbi:WXG100 family type VII secretion target [Nocardia farcinica]|uniref:WXG100 family type VII secretion target n=1 Tax=Nocardia farcinica TaxID=37329 RepID=UPI000A3BCC0A|nr:WXG100 family type VII secretion target [Nocardia farcinica]MBA4857711.1 WXG100 family type VII secretion target [Nocardia farcinica]MBC9817413.1 WXG100 family type VII secretion target [Nocardia farcinica]MBF6069439.1 WXG100 family type VII secretion target [Nocardia farcinica]MBF6251549.1 WXG100 family type VII secretion target [Nocardia farcinica]MBF6292288.1 WXG100 family type VII secretion target [Nocardia farcinica]
MTQGNFVADTAAINAKAKEFQEQHNNLMLAIRQLKTDEDNVTNGANWQGAARDAFNAFMERYYFQADRMNDKLMETSEKLLKMSGQFNEHDQDHASKVQAQVSSLDLPPV